MSEQEFFNEALEEYLTQYNTENSKRPLTQASLASSLGVTEATISHWKKGKAKPRNRQIVLGIARELKLNRNQTDHLLRLAEYPLLTGEEAQRFRAGGILSLQSALVLTAIKNRLPEFYVNRNSVLEEIGKLFWSTYPASNLAICGIGGAGKTVLAAGFLLQSEAQILKTFPDGILWIDLENQLLDPLVQISDQLGLEVAPESWTTLRQYITERTHSLKLLWVIDGSETVADATPWLDMAIGSKSSFIVTLRETPDPGWLAQRKARLLKVSNFQQEEGMKLTENILQTPLRENEISGWQKMAHLVSHHPLSLRILAGCAYFDLTAQRWENLTRAMVQKGTLAIQLGDADAAGDKNMSVHRCLQISYERLQQHNPAAAACFRFLGLLNSSDINPDLVAQLIDRDENTGRLLAVLAQTGLIEVNRESSSYRMHKLLHLFAYTLLWQNPDEYELAGRRYVSILINHLPAIPADIRQAVRDPFLGDYIYTVAIAYHVGLLWDALSILIRTHPILLGIGQSKQVIYAIEFLLPAFTQMEQLKGDPLAWLHKIYGDALFSQLKFEPALSYYDQVVGQSQNPLLLFKTHLQRAMCSHALERPMDVLDAIGNARQLMKILPGETNAILQQEYLLVLRQVELTEPGLVSTQAPSLLEQILDVHDLFADNRFSEGCNLLDKLDKELADSPLSMFQGEILQMLAHGYLRQAKYSQAYEAIQRLEKILRDAPEEADQRILWAHFWQHRGEYELQQKQLELARASLSKSLEIWKTIDNSDDLQHNIRALLRDIDRRLGR